MRAVECHGFSTDTDQRKNFWKCDMILVVISMKLLINSITPSVLHTDHRQGVFP